MAKYVDRPTLVAALSAQGGAGARTAANLDGARLDAALNEAESEVVGKLAGRYTLPDDPAAVPDLVKGIIVGIAAYVATLEWMQGKDLGREDPVALRYQRAEANLKAMADGVLVVDLPPRSVGGGSDGEVFNTVPAVGLTDDVPGPTYYGQFPGGWQGGGLTWQ